MNFYCDKIKQEFFQVVVMLVLLHGYTTWILTKRLEKKLVITICLEQILEAATHITTAIRSLISHLKK